MFIVLEGIDGCGKTTQCGHLYNWLLKELGNDSVLRTLEPGGWDGGSSLRELILNSEFVSLWSEFFLFMADRCEHVERVIRPALGGGKILLCDRYIPSTVAYQFCGDSRFPCDTADFVMDKLLPRLNLPVPDILFWLDIDTEVSRGRLISRGKRDLFDARGREYFERVADGYGRIMKRAGTAVRVERVDASRSEQEVFESLKSVLKSRIERLS